MSAKGEKPNFEIIRPPETAGEQWAESIRLAASIIDLNTQFNNHNANRTTKTGVTESPKFEEHSWKDPASDDRFVLRRFWSRNRATNPNWKADYQLRVHLGEEEFDLNSPDIIYAIDPSKKVDEKDSLGIVDDKKYVDLIVWCKQEGEDVDAQYDCVYEYLKTSQLTAEAQLTARRSRITGELSDDNAEFAKIILGEAVVAGEVHIEQTKSYKSFNAMDKSRSIARSIAKGDLTPRARWRFRRKTRKEPDEIYVQADTNPSKWRLSHYALASAVAEQLMNPRVDHVSSEDTDKIS